MARKPGRKGLLERIVEEREQQKLAEELEGVIERTEGVAKKAYIEVGVALLSIRERKLYKEKGYDTFEAYCREVWGDDAFDAFKLFDAHSQYGRQRGTAYPVNSRV